MSRRVLVGFGSISLNRVWFMRRLNLLPILPISTAKQNVAGKRAAVDGARRASVG